MSLLSETIEAIRAIGPVSEEARAGAQERLDSKTKPRRSLGRLEDLACSVAAIQRTSQPRIRNKAIVVMVADHGVAADGVGVAVGVSAYPQEVTAQMLANFASGGAAVSVLARHAGVQVLVVDMGVAGGPHAIEGVRSFGLPGGTKNFSREAAMTSADAERCIEIGIKIALELRADDVDLVGLGEMGIGNTTSASAVLAALISAPPSEIVGRGTGIDADALERKIEVIERALDLHKLTGRESPEVLEVLTRVGGFEIAGLAGLTLGAAACGIAVVVDGFIASVAALAAARLAPESVGSMIPSHLSTEPGHRRALDALGLTPMLDMNMRLGEGTGAALAFPLVESALKILDEMATFESASVSKSASADDAADVSKSASADDAADVSEPADVGDSGA